MDNMEYIENYFKGINTDEQKQQFDKKILEDASFAEEVAFYISANGVLQQQLQEEKKQRFREIYKQRKVVSIKQPVKTIWRYLAAASVVAAVMFSIWFFDGGKTTSQQLANNYIEQNWKTLSGTMGNQDSLQNGLDLYISGKDDQALAIFESLAQNDPSNTDAKIYAGIVSVRLQDYDKALRYFTMLEADTALTHNPGKFYKAVTLLKRDKTGDKEAAKLLLKDVRDQKLQGMAEAAEWLGKLN